MNKIINNKSLNTESKKIDYSKSNYKNKDNIKLDSNGDEIVYEVRHKLIWLNYIVSVFLSLLGSLLTLGILGVMFDGEIGFILFLHFFIDRICDGFVSTKRNILPK